MDKQIDRYSEVFTPGRPVSDERLFVGRSQEKEDLEKVLKRPGRHAIVIGDRGVGKTTVVKQVLRQQNVPFAWRSCSPRLRYDQIFRDLLRELKINIDKIETVQETESSGGGSAKVLGLGVSGEIKSRDKVSFRANGSDILTPWTTFRLLRDKGANAILVIDEYDAIRSSNYREDPDLHENIAYTLKHISDHSDQCRATIIVVGIAFTAESLLGKHESIERNAREIYLQPLRYQDFRDFIEEAENLLGIQFDDKVKFHLAADANGFPYFVHLVGLEAIESMLASNKKAKTIQWLDFMRGLERAADAAFRAELSKYRSALNKMRQKDKQIMNYLVNWRSSSANRRFFREKVVKALSISYPDFDSALTHLEKDLRFIYVTRHTDDIRFVDPLLKPFLRAKFRKFLRGPADTQQLLFPETE